VPTIARACVIREVDASDAALQRLLKDADREFLERYPELNGQRRGPLLPSIRFLIAYRRDAAVGCLALQPGGIETSQKSWEVKRLFVSPRARRSGEARQLMNAVENLAKSLGADVICFETGYRQPEAMQLVGQLGYERIPLYPPYLGDPFGRCFAKFLCPSSSRT
jgi:GNAT superfamily N-acetyltransferase